MNGARTSGESRPAAPRRGRVHFCVAAVILVVAAGGFHTAKHTLKIHLVKKPVPWPEAIQPGHLDEHRLTSFPDRLGPYYRVARDGELNKDKETGQPILDGEPDGIMKFRHEQIGEMDITNHPLNWYYSAVYVDTRPRSGRSYRLDVTYYTGLLDAVPHVPDICVRAGGGAILTDSCGPVEIAVPALHQPWDRFTIRRIAYPQSDKWGRVHTMAEYYVFSMNGQPTASRYRVRGELTIPWVKYCYFAKVQVLPFRPESTLKKMDESCEDFLRHAMPEVLRFLPSATTVNGLNGAKKF